MELLILVFIALFAPVLAKKFIFKHELTWPELFAVFAISSFLVALAYNAGKYTNTLDTEIHNGIVKNKVREHDTYLESYSCNCITTSYTCGKSTCTKTTCQTCYRRHYTVEWFLETTIGEIRLDYIDTTSSSVYKTPDPSIFINAQIGEHCAKRNNYVNYVKASPDSLFNFVQHKTALEKFKNNVRQYNQNVYGLYKYNHVWASHIPLQEQENWKNAIADYLKHVGNDLQMNIQLIITPIEDPTYRYAVESVWNGGKKNDLVILVGSKNYPNIDWVDSFTFANSKSNEKVVAQLNSELRELKQFTIKNAMPVIKKITQANFKRVQMKEFNYLMEDVDPPTWAMVLIILLQICIILALSMIFANNSIKESSHH